jgi:GNAT superfamily N-acetyltransferase
MEYKPLLVRTWTLAYQRKDVPALLPAPSGYSLSTWHPGVEEYLSVYHTIGKEWGWTLRLRQDEEQVLDYLLDKRVRLWQIGLENRIFGFAEIDARSAGNCEITYLGVIPPMVGKGLGTDLLRMALRTVWDEFPGRIWLHTCALDHKAALGFYQREGFRIESSSLREELYPADFMGYHGLREGQTVDEGFRMRERL